MEDVLDINLRRDELSAKLGGGIPTNSIVLIEGVDGAGKSIISQRIAYSIVKNNHTVSYISSELTMTGFVQQMASLDYNIKDELLANQILFLSIFPYIGDTKLSNKFMERLLATKKIFEKEVIIFDTLSFLIIQDDISKEKMFHFVKTLKKIASLNKTIIFCVDPGHLNPVFLTLLRNISDVYMNLEIKSILGNILRVLNVMRFKRSLEEVTSAIPFKVEPKVGISIELASLS